jgi:septin family protein
MADDAAQSTPEIDQNLKEYLELRQKCPRFRVLVIGRANAGKTTICQKMCNTTDPPVVHGRDGKEVCFLFTKRAFKRETDTVVLRGKVSPSQEVCEMLSVSSLTVHGDL